MSYFSFNNPLIFSNSLGKISESIQSFLNSRKLAKRSPDTIRFYRLMLSYNIAWLTEHGITEWEELTPSVIRALLLDLQQTGHEQGGVHARYRAIKAYINWFWDEYDIESKNPILKVHCSNRPPTPIQGIKIDEVDKLLKACEHNRFSIRDKALIFILADTGLRKQEVMMLKRSDVDCDSGEIIVRHGKGDKLRYVYMGRECRKAVRKYFRLLQNIKPEDTIWYTDGGYPLTPNGGREILRRTQKAAGLERIHGFHDFRRCYALESKRNGSSDIEVSRSLGHSSLEVTKRYICFEKEDDMLNAQRSSPMDHRKKN